MFHFTQGVKPSLSLISDLPLSLLISPYLQVRTDLNTLHALAPSIKCSGKINLNHRSRPPEVFLGKDVLKICSKYTGEYPCRSAISTKLQSNFIEIRLQNRFSPVNLLHIFRTSFLKNAFWWLFQNQAIVKCIL